MRKVSLVLSFFLLFFMFSCSDKETKILIATSYGNIKVKLYNETPQHRDNFIAMIKEGKTDAFVFDRIVEDFVIDTVRKNCRG